MTTERRIAILETKLTAKRPSRELRDDLSDEDLAVAFIPYLPHICRDGDPREAQETHDWVWGVLIGAFGPRAYAPLGFAQPPTLQQIMDLPTDKLRNHIRGLSRLGGEPY
ncbi:MAG: hypothetical protein AB7P12_07945 [Alphaproteobacteria bacterium]